LDKTKPPILSENQWKEQKGSKAISYQKSVATSATSVQNTEENDKGQIKIFAKIVEDF
jgi:hypothetical protein